MEFRTRLGQRSIDFEQVSSELCATAARARPSFPTRKADARSGGNLQKRAHQAARQDKTVAIS